ncbi:MAG: DUF2807 domain-containing protein [Acidiphilium sp.]|nr:DUF2807 domain-containing protein [Acidiphilium sp.]MDD4935853.1 DUF2807 domain-containing protein [Acidiphilium sp.]
MAVASGINLGLARGLAVAIGAVLLAMPSARATTTSVTRTVAPFSSVRLDGRFILDVTTAPHVSVRLTGDRYLIDNLQIGVSQGVLSIVRPQEFDLPKDVTVTIAITAPALTGVDLRGLIHASLTGLTGPKFTFINNGAAAATLSGKVGTFKLVSRGVTSIEARALHAATVTMMVRGKGYLRVFASQKAMITMYGEGEVDVYGHPPIHQFKTLAYGVVTLK